MRSTVVYTRPLCVWCFRAKWLLRRRGVAFDEVDASSDAVRAELLARTGRNTVPQVFVGEVHVGGFDDLRALDGADGLMPLVRG
jgi:glutaredoxin 3